MEIRLCEDKKEWNKLPVLPAFSEFLQSWEWGEFQQSVGNRPLRLLIEKGNEISGLQGFAHKLPLGISYLYIPRFENLKLETGNLKFEIMDYLKKQSFVFARMEPSSSIVNFQSLVSNFQFSVSFTQNRQPRATLIIDLSQTLDAIQEQMHSKTRYNIRLAEKKKVIIKKEKDIEVFWKLNEETKERDKFKSHDKKYYQKMLEQENVFQLTAVYQNQPIASNICIRFGNVFTYLHGTSSNEYRNLMAPYLLQWEGIKFAKSLGCQYYDFWGIAPSTMNNEQLTTNKPVETCFHNLCWQAGHEWTGVTRFKAGFGGFVKEYPQAVDVVFRPLKYNFYKLMKRLVK